MSTPSIPLTVSMPSDLPALSPAVPSTSSTFSTTTVAFYTPKITSTFPTNVPHLDLSLISPTKKTLPKQIKAKGNRPEVPLSKKILPSGIKRKHGRSTTRWRDDIKQGRCYG